MILYDCSLAFKDKELDFKKPVFGGPLERLNPCRWEVASYEDRERWNQKNDGKEYYIFSTSVDDDDLMYGDFDIMLDAGMDYPYFDDSDYEDEDDQDETF